MFTKPSIHSNGGSLAPVNTDCSSAEMIRQLIRSIDRKLTDGFLVWREVTQNKDLGIFHYLTKQTVNRLTQKATCRLIDNESNG